MMKPLTCLLILAVWLFMIGLCPAQNSITLWNQEMVITEEDSPFVVEFAYIADGGVLRLEAGAHLVIRPSPDHMNPLLVSDGQLIANGTAERPVTIEHEGVYFYPIEIATSDDKPPALQLNHTHWKLGPNSVYVFPWDNTQPIVVVRNSIIESTCHASRDSWGRPEVAAFFLGSWSSAPCRIIFEDSILKVPNAGAFILANGEPRLELRRCVITGGTFDRDVAAIDGFIYSGHLAPRILLDQCRINGYMAAVRSDFGGSGGVDSRIEVLDSDLSGSIHSIDSRENGSNLLITVRDSHISPILMGKAHKNSATVNIARTHVTNNAPSTDLPEYSTVHDPVTAPPFRHADINSDGRTGLSDLQLLQDVLAGLIEPDDVPDPSALDVDGDGHLDIRDLAVLRAYVDGFLAFLPGDVQP